MTCQEVRALLLRHPGECTNAEVAGVTRHCMACPACDAALSRDAREEEKNLSSLECFLADLQGKLIARRVFRDPEA